MWHVYREGRHRQVSLIHPSVFLLMGSPGLWTVRVFGVGLKFKDIRKRPLIFSERYGYQRGVQVGPYRLAYLKRRR